MNESSQGFDALVQKTSDSLYDLNTSVRRVRSLNANTGSRFTGRLAAEMEQMTEQYNHSCKLVEELNKWSDLTEGQKRQKKEIDAAFDLLLENVRETVSITLRNSIVQAHETEVEQAEGRQAVAANDEPSETTTPLLQVLEHLDQGETDLHTSLIEDRDQEIANIQRGMLEINAIFRDLSSLVGEQGHRIDTIEENIYQVAQQTDGAAQQLVNANRRQRQRGKWSCILLLILLLLSILVGISVFA